MIFKIISRWSSAYLFLNVLYACTTPAEDNTTAKPVAQKLIETDSVIVPQANPGSIAELFGYHNKLTVNDQLTFDILSVGTPSTGSYLILKSDKAKLKYTTMSGERQGTITGSNAADLDKDEQIEILVFLKKGREAYGNVIIHEIDSLNNHTEINLPDLSTDILEGYKGQDTFYVDKSKIVRKFPIYKATKPIGKTRRIEYVLKNNALLSSGHVDE